MLITIAAVGRLPAGQERDLYERYLERSKKLAAPLGVKFADREIAQSRKKRPEDRRSEEAASLAAATPAAAVLVVLDERGAALSTEDFAGKIDGWRTSGRADLVFAIGGPDGLAPGAAKNAALAIAFGRMTWPHQLVRAMLAEQLYRAMTILTGHPYHRA